MPATDAIGHYQEMAAQVLDICGNPMDLIELRTVKQALPHSSNKEAAVVLSVLALDPRVQVVGTVNKKPYHKVIYSPEGEAMYGQVATAVAEVIGRAAENPGQVVLGRLTERVLEQTEDVLPDSISLRRRQAMVGLLLRASHWIQKDSRSRQYMVKPHPRRGILPSDLCPRLSTDEMLSTSRSIATSAYTRWESQLVVRNDQILESAAGIVPTPPVAYDMSRLIFLAFAKKPGAEFIKGDTSRFFTLVGNDPAKAKRLQELTDFYDEFISTIQADRPGIFPSDELDQLALDYAAKNGLRWEANPKQLVHFLSQTNPRVFNAIKFGQHGRRTESVVMPKEESMHSTVQKVYEACAATQASDRPQLLSVGPQAAAISLALRDHDHVCVAQVPNTGLITIVPRSGYHEGFLRQVDTIHQLADVVCERLVDEYSASLPVSHFLERAGRHQELTKEQADMLLDLLDGSSHRLENGQPYSLIRDPKNKQMFIVQGPMPAASLPGSHGKFINPENLQGLRNPKPRKSNVSDVKRPRK